MSKSSRTQLVADEGVGNNKTEGDEDVYSSEDDG